MATPPRRVLISGASVAGPAAAYWLARAGAEVTVVEKSPSVRNGGYPIDLRGPAIEVVRRMGVYEEVRDAHISTEYIRFISSAGRPLMSRKNSQMAGHVEGQDLELPRGALTTALMHAVAKCETEFLFENSVESLVDRPQGVEVTFADGTERTFDLVIGADGQHSRVRELAFGPERQFDRYLGWCFAGFTMPNPRGYHHEALIFNQPGRFATIYAAPGADLGFIPTQAATAGGPAERVFAFLSFKSPRPTYEEARDTERMRAIVLDAWEGVDEWEIPTMREALRVADDVFADTVNQIRMPRWSKGRVAVVGDAAYAASFLTGQGTGIALLGAYVLAHELARHDSHVEAFSAYEHAMRDFITKNQALADDGVRSTILAKQSEIRRRNLLLRVYPLLNRLGVTKLFGARIIETANAIDLSGYRDALTPSSAG